MLGAPVPSCFSVFRALIKSEIEVFAVFLMRKKDLVLTDALCPYEIGQIQTALLIANIFHVILVLIIYTQTNTLSLH